MTNDGCCRTALYCDYYYSFFFFCILFVHAPSKAGVLRAITETTEAGGKCAREFAPLLKMLNRKFLHRMKRKAQRHVTRRTDCMCAEIAIWLMTTNGGKTEKKNYRNEFRCKREKRIGRYIWCKIMARTARTAGTARAKAKKKNPKKQRTSEEMAASLPSIIIMKKDSTSPSTHCHRQIHLQCSF